MRKKRLGNQLYDAGFSLTEVLMAVFIISLASTFVVLAGPKRTPPIIKQGQAMRLAMEDASEQAMVSGQPISIQIERSAYSTHIWNGEKWQLTGKTVKFPQDIIADIQGSSSISEASGPAISEVVFDPTGISKRSVVILSDNRTDIALVVTEDGSVKMERENVEQFR